MTPYEFVWSIIQEHLQQAGDQWHVLAKKTGISENTLRYSISQGTARHKTLYNVVAKLEGEKKGREFLIEHESSLKGLSTTISVAKLQQQHQNDHDPAIMEPSVHEIIMYTDATRGIDYGELISHLPHRKKLVDQLLDDGILERVGDRLFSHFTAADPHLGVKKIRVKSDVIANSCDEFRAGCVSTSDERVSVEGYIELTKLTRDYIAKSLEIMARTQSDEGVSFTQTTLRATLGLNKKTRSSIYEQLGENDEI